MAPLLNRSTVSLHPPRLPSDAQPPDTAPQRLRSFAAALRELASRQDVDQTLQLGVDLAVELIPGAAHADIMFVRKGGVTTPVSSDPVAIELDRVQAEAGAGPCIEAASGEAVVTSQDLANDQRWPAFAAAALEHGTVSAAAFQLFLGRHDNDRFGALNLYGDQVGTFGENAIALGEVFAAMCASALASAIDKEGVTNALATRDVIGQAKGILMERHKITAAQAFTMLKERSQVANVKLRELARTIADTGTLA